MPLTGDGALGGSKFYASRNCADNLRHAFRNLSLHMEHAFENSANRDDQGSVASSLPFGLEDPLCSSRNGTEIERMFISSNYNLAADATDEHYNWAQGLPPLARLSAAVVDVIDAMIPSIDSES